MYTYNREAIYFEKSAIDLSLNQLEYRNDLFNESNSSTNSLSNYQYSSPNYQSSNNLSPNYESISSSNELNNKKLDNENNKNQIDINYVDELTTKLPSIDSLLNHDQSNNERLNYFLDKNQQVINIQSDDLDIYKDNSQSNSFKKPVDSKFYYNKGSLTDCFYNNKNQLILNERATKSFPDISFLHDNYQISNNLNNQLPIDENQFKTNQNIQSNFNKELCNNQIKLIDQFESKTNNQIKSQINQSSNISNNQFNLQTFNSSGFNENQTKNNKFNVNQLIEQHQFDGVLNNEINYSKSTKDDKFYLDEFIDVCDLRKNDKNDLKQFSNHNSFYNLANNDFKFNYKLNNNSSMINHNQNINYNYYHSSNQPNEFKYSNQYQLDKLYNLNNQVNNLKGNQPMNQQIYQFNNKDQNNQLNLTVDKQKDYMINTLKHKMNDKSNLIKNKKQNLKINNQSNSMKSNTFNFKINRKLIKKKTNNRIKCTRNKNLSFEEQEIKRDKANSQERNRMHKINLALNDLKRKMQSVLSDETNDFNFNLSKIKQLYDLKLDCNYDMKFDCSNDNYNQNNYTDQKLDQQQNLISNSSDSSNSSVKNFKSKKLSKIATLKLAISYIFYLSKQLNKI